MAEDKPFISFKNVKKSYDGKTVIVDNLNLDIRAGEFVSLLGPSGSGKTTCLMMLAGFEALTQGNILIDGVPVQNTHPNKRNIGMVFQNYALFPHMTVFENLAFPLEVRHMPKKAVDKQVKKILEIVRLAEFGNRRIAQLSGGQQQRVAVARALAFEPKIVLMDEPLGALDKNLREDMQLEIKHLHEKLDITIVYVTHDQSEAITMSDRVAVFNDGEIQQYSTPKKLYENPTNSFVANFVGENNSLKGKVKKITDTLVEIDVNGTVICGKKQGNFELGGIAELSVRPEKILLDTLDNTENILYATIEEMIYMGDHIKLRLEILGNDQFIVKILMNQQLKKFTKGERLNVGWSYHDCCILE